MVWAGLGWHSTEEGDGRDRSSHGGVDKAAERVVDAGVPLLLQHQFRRPVLAHQSPLD